MAVVRRDVPWPVTIGTARLVLRPVVPPDLPAMAEVWSSPQVRRYLGGPVPPGELASRLGGCVGARGLFAVVRAADRAVLGLILVEPESPAADPYRAGDPEVSYQLLPQYWGHGYGREAVGAVLRWAFSALVPAPGVVIAVTQTANRASARLLEAVGMTRTGGFTEFGAAQSRYSITKDALTAAPPDDAVPPSPAPGEVQGGGAGAGSGPGMVPRLIVINGPPACGKSTLARMYAAAYPLALALDVDAVRGCLGRWQQDLPSAGRAARVIALAAAGAHLRAGHDVVVPQFLRRPAFLAELHDTARDAGAGFAEIALLAGKEQMLRAYAARAASQQPADIAAHHLAGHPSDAAALAALHDQYTAFLTSRPTATLIPVTPGQPELTYTAMLTALHQPPARRPATTPGNRQPSRTLAEPVQTADSALPRSK